MSIFNVVTCSKTPIIEIKGTDWVLQLEMNSNWEAHLWLNGLRNAAINATNSKCTYNIQLLIDFYD